MKTAIRALMAAIIFGGLVVPLTAEANDCHDLALSVASPYYISSISCTSGVMSYLLPNGAYFRQDNGHGPTCQVFVCKTGIDCHSWYSKFILHQNLCVMKAGNIKVTYEAGHPPTYTAKEGSFLHSRQGKIDVTGFQEY